MYFELFQSAPRTAAGAGVSAFHFAKNANVVAPFPRILPAVGDAYGREFLTLQQQPAKRECCFEGRWLKFTLLI